MPCCTMWRWQRSLPRVRSRYKCRNCGHIVKKRQRFVTCNHPQSYLKFTQKTIKEEKENYHGAEVLHFRKAKDEHAAVEKHVPIWTVETASSMKIKLNPDQRLSSTIRAEGLRNHRRTGVPVWTVENCPCRRGSTPEATNVCARSLRTASKIADPSLLRGR